MLLRPNYSKNLWLIVQCFKHSGYMGSRRLYEKCLSGQLRGIVDNYDRNGYNLNVIRRTVCLVINALVPGRVAQSVGHLTHKSGVLGSIPGLATYFRFSFRFFKKGSCQLLAKVCARSTG